MNYLERVAQAIYEAAFLDADWDSETDKILYRIYAVLALSKGVNTTNEDVHDAWSAWMLGYHPDHWSIIPYQQLPAATQALDEPYTRAIHEVAQGMQGWTT
jgi:hypothetical protein